MSKHRTRGQKLEDDCWAMRERERKKREKSETDREWLRRNGAAPNRHSLTKAEMDRQWLERNGTAKE
jgi:hypothetical protein